MTLNGTFWNKEQRHRAHAAVCIQLIKLISEVYSSHLAPLLLCWWGSRPRAHSERSQVYRAHQGARQAVSAPTWALSARHPCCTPWLHTCIFSPGVLQQSIGFPKNTTPCSLGQFQCTISLWQNCPFICPARNWVIPCPQQPKKGTSSSGPWLSNSWVSKLLPRLNLFVLYVHVRVQLKTNKQAQQHKNPNQKPQWFGKLLVFCLLQGEASLLKLNCFNLSSASLTHQT